ncbi:FkbM family methyltransferase [Phragmitibacter flavus]|nr:FkbM family methyltransferase [Phragmitibacter flavus]
MEVTEEHLGNSANSTGNVITLRGIQFSLEGMSPKMRAVLIEGEYELMEADACATWVKEGDRVLELGSAIGFIGLHCLKNCGAASVVSVEANPRTAECLKENYRLNGLAPQVLKVAVTTKDEEVDLYVGPDFWSDSVCLGFEETENIRVPGCKFTTLWQSLAAKPNVLVVDIEGEETAIDWSHLPTEIKLLVVEFHPVQTGYDSMFEMIRCVLNSGFEGVLQNGYVNVFRRD